MLRGSMGAIVGGGGGGGGGKGEGWCRCKDGPQPVAEPPAPELLRETILKQEPGYVHPLKDVAKIKVWFRKPMVEPIDLTPLLSPD